MAPAKQKQRDSRGGPTASKDAPRIAQPDPTVLPKLTRLVETMAKGLGFAVWGVEYAAGARGAIARIYLDLQGNEGVAAGPGRPEVSIDDCATFSRHVSVALDAEDTIPGSYTLEVSSPGIERRFFRLAQLPPYVGRELALQLMRPLDGPASEDEFFIGRKRFQGVLDAVLDSAISMDIEGRTVEIPWQNIRQARLVHSFDTPQKPKGASKKAPMQNDGIDTRQAAHPPAHAHHDQDNDQAVHQANAKEDAS